MLGLKTEGPGHRLDLRGWFRPGGSPGHGPSRLGAPQSPRLGHMGFSEAPVYTAHGPCPATVEGWRRLPEQNTT